METLDVQHCPGFVIVLDREGIILRANPAAERAFGKRVAKGAILAHSVHSEDRTDFANRWGELLDGAGEAHAVSRIQNSDGSTYRRYSWTATYVGAQNEIHAMFLPLGEEEVRKAFRLEDPAVLLQALLDHCDISCSVIDRDGVFLFQEGKAVQKDDKNRSVDIGRSIFDLYGRELPDQMAMIRKTLAAGEVTSWRVDFQNMLLDVKCIPLRDENGSIQGALLPTVDKSDVKQTLHELKAKLALIERQQEVIRDLETPIIQVWDHVLTLPMVGVVDSQRAARVMNDLLEMVVSKSAHYAILDLTGVDTVDTATASHLIQMVSSIRLLGAEGIISGIRPTVAQTLVSLGVDISAIKTCANLQSALRFCIRRLAAEKTAPVI